MEDTNVVLAQHSEQIKTLFQRLERVEHMGESLNELVVATKEIALNQTNMARDITTLKSDVETMKSEPAQKWKTVTSKILWVLIAAILGVVLGKFGL